MFVSWPCCIIGHCLDSRLPHLNTLSPNTLKHCYVTQLLKI
uniref:Uncharacterized protein n=1 Tax=Anguilla anguilla TaxID=7936 RepID=A0A0E9XC04_ANGAN